MTPSARLGLLSEMSCNPLNSELSHTVTPSPSAHWDIVIQLCQASRALAAFAVFHIISV